MIRLLRRYGWNVAGFVTGWMLMSMLLQLPGCGGVRAITKALTPPAPPAQPAPTAGTSLEDQLKAAHDARDAADIHIASLEKRIVEQDDQHTRHTLLLIALVCLLGFGGSSAAIFWLPVGKRAAFAFAVGFCAIGLMALLARSLVPYLPCIGLGLVGLFGIALIMNARKIHDALTAAVHFGVDMTAAETLKDAEVVKVRHLSQQVRSGVHGLIEQTLSQVKAEVKAEETGQVSP